MRREVDGRDRLTARSHHRDGNRPEPVGELLVVDGDPCRADTLELGEAIEDLLGDFES